MPFKKVFLWLKAMENQRVITTLHWYTKHSLDPKTKIEVNPVVVSAFDLESVDVMYLIRLQELQLPSCGEWDVWKVVVEL